VHDGPLLNWDQAIAKWNRPVLPNWGDWVVYNLDHLGLRGLTATILLLLSIYLGWKFETWRPFNLSVISLLALNAVVGLAKLEFGRTKPRLNVDLLYAGGMSYPSGHESNAVLTWGLIAYLYIQYVQPRLEVVRAASISVVVISTIVFWVSIFRNTHWLSDLLGGVAIGTALLLLIIAVDRSIPSRRSNP
jgi:membrane-associated phospholipid phosphatase